MTTLTFHVSRSIGATLGAGDEIVVTTLDHEANVSPWRALAADRDLVVRTVDIHAEDGTLDLDHLASVLGPRTRLVAVGWASNALGTINPVAEIAAMGHAHGALVFVDAVHYVPHAAVDVATLGADILVTSPYKWFGPHAGVLWARRRGPGRGCRPTRSGRPTIRSPRAHPPSSSSRASARPSTTSRTSAARSGVDRRSRLVAAMTAIREHEAGLSTRFMRGLAALPGTCACGASLTPLGSTDRTPTFGITSASRTPREMAEALGRAGIFAWNGHFYAQALIERLGLAETGGVLRLGFVHYNTADEVDRTLEALEAIVAR